MSNKSNNARDTVPSRKALYTPEQRERRDATVWTTVQGILAPLQFLIFLISLGLIFRTLLSSVGYELATVSIVLKTLILYIIMITGAIWEKVVFGKYLFAEAFFWEDVFSMLVLALHTLYLGALLASDWSAKTLLWIALAAYASYLINASQFLLKLRKARLDRNDASKASSHGNIFYPQIQKLSLSGRISE